MRACELCGAEYVAKRERSRFCSNSCRAKASQRAQRGEVVAIDEAEVGPVERSTQSALTSAGLAGTPLMEAAVVLARRVDTAKAESGSSTAALVKELRATLAEATKEAKVAADPMDELHARRQARARGAG